MSTERPAVVTGAAGFFGLAIVRALSAAGVRVVACDRVAADVFEPRPGTRIDLVEYRRCDVAEDPLDGLLAGAGGVVHAAALTPADERDAATAAAVLRVNVGGVARVLAAMEGEPGCSRLVLVSSAAVYDQDAPGRRDEEAASGGSSLYGAAKLAGEIVARRAATLAGWDFCAVRPTSLYGAGEIVRESRPRVSAFARLVAAARSGTRVRLERPESRADWLCVDDAADAVALLWLAPGLDGSSYNLSSGVARPFREVAEAVASAGLVVAPEADASVDGGPDRPAAFPNDRLRAAVAWQPRRSLAEVARELLRRTGPCRH
jgi:nucleoside-diphosphate-sugar epimerase